MIYGVTRRTALGFVALSLAACSDQLTEPETQPADVAPSAAAPDLAVTSAATGTWVTKANVPDAARDQVALAMVPNAAGQSIVYAIAGKNLGSGPTGRFHAYNVATNTWSRKPDLPVAVYNTNGAGVINGKIYVSGGVRGDKLFTDQLYMYDPATNVWTRKQGLPDDTWGGITGVINNQLYVLTCSRLEQDCYGDPTSLELYRYNPTTDRWTFLGDSPRQKGKPLGGVIGGKLYFTGMDSFEDGQAPRFTMYDPVTNQWTAKTPPPKALQDAAGYATLGAKLYIFGGRELQPDGSFQLVRTTRVYDPATNSWSNGTNMPTLRPNVAATRVVLNGKARIEVVGGSRPGNNLQYVP
jgi:N-acetylneuraminic acid mutarotase